ncbi:MAG: glutathione S-transferase N-terminal domain-containing protein [Selenomonadaceae bacterium]|nr:glutathione S-transferase N-terminal domain-containing protein [Selenomonadaceae bacterium]MBQ6759746.1 glutathione S-transferase N-terminal domain-containing protein [Selenomonadaceae bacterium]MBR0102274.1 glutathione S-transferase N-terminal domain-containing protein [Selenomonadaceae bacterium]
MVKVYSFESCPWCNKLKNYLKARGVEFETRDIELSEEAAAECQKISGDLTVPVTTIDGVHYVLGFDKKKIDELLASA